MLLFNGVKSPLVQALPVFQNILCYCLTSFPFMPEKFNYISKHPMLLFNFTGDDDLWIYIEFQNILCYCLTASKANQNKKT